MSAVQIIGLKELNQMFAQFPQAFNKIFMDAGNKYSNTIYNQANQKVPVKTGRLKRSIGRSVSQTQIAIFADAPYATHINYGTKWMPGRPFLTQPAEQQIPQMIKEINMNIASYFKSRANK